MRPVPVIAFHGTADPIVPYQGGIESRFGEPFPAIQDWARRWAGRNGCGLDPEEIPGTGEVSGIRYTGCDENAEVILYSIDGGGHTWPGGNPLPEFIAGRTSQAIDASRVMWDFYQQHPMP
jgi:polyhydroxybutyrate depolymerase